MVKSVGFGREENLLILNCTSHTGSSHAFFLLGSLDKFLNSGFLYKSFKAGSSGHK